MSKYHLANARQKNYSIIKLIVLAKLLVESMYVIIIYLFKLSWFLPMVLQ
jgi:hypothetical protein